MPTSMTTLLSMWMLTLVSNMPICADSGGGGAATHTHARAPARARVYGMCARTIVRARACVRVRANHTQAHARAHHCRHVRARARARVHARAALTTKNGGQATDDGWQTTDGRRTTTGDGSAVSDVGGTCASVVFEKLLSQPRFFPDKFFDQRLVTRKVRHAVPGPCCLGGLRSRQ